MDNNKVLRASRIGSLCDRALFYSVNGAEEIISENRRKILEVGRVLEPVIVHWLRNDGWNVRRNLFINSNEGMSLSLSVNGGIIEAHPDCVISREDSGLILADIKTMNDRSFRSLKREGQSSLTLSTQTSSPSTLTLSENVDMRLTLSLLSRSTRTTARATSTSSLLSRKDTMLSKNVLREFSLVRMHLNRATDFSTGAAITAVMLICAN